MDFLGYIRPDGSVGVRNRILVISTAPQTDMMCLNVTNTVLNTVPVLCGVCGAEIKDYAGPLIKNPNVAGAVVLESNPEGIGEKIVSEAAEMGKPAALVDISCPGGVIEAAARATRAAMIMSREVSAQRRQLTPVLRMVLGLIYGEQSGTGDLLYHCIDIIGKNHGRVVISRPKVDKKSLIGRLPVVKQIDPEGKIDKQQGLYELKPSPYPAGTLTAMASLGVQLVVDSTGGRYSGSHTVLPVINITADKALYERFQDGIELDLSDIDSKNYRIEDFSLLIVNEIIATASGKLTKAEALKF
ncbi:MAG: UxaA family hydrolase [Bacillota bacterium]